MEFEWVNTPLPPVKVVKEDRGTGMVGASAGGDNSVDKEAGFGVGGADVDYDVAEEDDRWMVE